MIKQVRANKISWLLVLLLLPFGVAKAQQPENDATQQETDATHIDPASDRILKFHTLQLGELYFSYEKLRTDKVSNELGLSYIYRAYLKGDGSAFIALDGRKVQGIAVRMSQRHYTSEKRTGTPFGFFHGPGFGYRFMAFEDNALGQPQLPPGDLDYRYIGRLYQNALELNYQLGSQFKLGKHLNMEASVALGARLKYAYAKGGGDLLESRIIGHTLTSDANSAVVITPLPQVNLSLGYAF